MNVGLGNPGPSYAGNRHNVGAMVVDALADRARVSLKAHKARARGAQIRLEGSAPGVPGPPAVIAVPSTYMNEAGGPVAALLRFFKIPPEQLIVVHDELDIDYGVVRLKKGGGEGGHNGLRSISTSLGTKDYLRVRVGIGRPPGRMDAAAYVLKDFSAQQRPELDFLLPSAVEAVDLLVQKGLTEAQNAVHGT